MTFFQNFARNPDLSAWTLFTAGMSTPGGYTSGVVNGQYRLAFSVGGAAGSIWINMADGLLLYRPLAGQQWLLTARVAMEVSALQAFGGIGVFRPAEINLGAGTRAWTHIDSVVGLNPFGTVHRRAEFVDGAGPSVATTLAGLGAPGPASGLVSILRRGNTFYVYYSRTGLSWSLRHVTTIAMPDPCYVGLIVQGTAATSAGVLTCDYIRARSYR
jgi:hypothetical protein